MKKFIVFNFGQERVCVFYSVLAIWCLIIEYT